MFVVVGRKRGGDVRFECFLGGFDGLGVGGEDKWIMW